VASGYSAECSTERDEAGLQTPRRHCFPRDVPPPKAKLISRFPRDALRSTTNEKDNRKEMKNDPETGHSGSPNDKKPSAGQSPETTPAKTGGPIDEREIQRRLTDLIEKVTRRTVRSLDNELREDLGFTDDSLEDFNRDLEIEFEVRVENITDCDTARDLLEALLEALTPEEK